MKPVVALLVLWNLVTFLLFVVDKRRAVRHAWRIRERTLLVSAFAMGGVGAFCGMHLLRHKTRRWAFRLLIPLALVANGALLFWGAKGFPALHP